MWQLINPETFIYSQWAGGTTTQMAIWPQRAIYATRDFSYRISRASVEIESSAFTALPGFKRFLTITEGTLDLKHNDAPWLRLMPYEVHEFDGGDQTQALGCVKDFNLMLASGVQGEMLSIALAEGDVYETKGHQANEHLWLYVAAGDIHGGKIGEFFRIEEDVLSVCALSEAVVIICRIKLNSNKE